MTPTCGQITFMVEPTGEAADWEGKISRNYEIHAMMFNQPVGEMKLTLQEHPDLGQILRVKLIDVRKPRCGVGTKFYERAVKLACMNNAKLTSDVERTEASEGFWRKQEQKGRARCWSPDAAPEGVRVHFDTARGVWLHTGDRWPCRRYVLREACPRKLDLSGPRRRKWR